LILYAAAAHPFTSMLKCGSEDISWTATRLRLSHLSVEERPSCAVFIMKRRTKLLVVSSAAPCHPGFSQYVFLPQTTKEGRRGHTRMQKEALRKKRAVKREARRRSPCECNNVHRDTAATACLAGSCQGGIGRIVACVSERAQKASPQCEEDKDRR
jgi:hypothetical protein